MNMDSGQWTHTHSLYSYIDSISAQFDFYHSHFQIYKLTHTFVIIIMKKNEENPLKLVRS